ncbi:hypothetical protein [Halocatena marina]
MIELPVETLKKAAFGVSPEVLEDDDIEIFIPNEAYENIPPLSDLAQKVKYAEVYEDEDRGWYILFFGEVESYTTHQSSRGSRWHPPEYVVEEIMVGFELCWYPADNHGLSSATIRYDWL